MEFINPVSNFLQKIVLTAFADWQVVGRENVPPMGPLIIVANHQSNFDPTLLSTSIPRRTWFLAKEGIFRGPFASWFLRQYGAFPLKRDLKDMRAFRWALGQLDRDQAVVVFPEGTRTRGGMRKSNPGIVQLALKSQAPLLPVGITGTERLGTLMRVFNPTGKLRVNIGTAFSVPPIDGRLDRELLDSLTDMIMQRVAALLPESYRGVYAIKGREGVSMGDRAKRSAQDDSSP